MPVDDQDIAWLEHNQASLARRFERVENSLFIRALQKLSRGLKAGKVDQFWEGRLDLIANNPLFRNVSRKRHPPLLEQLDPSHYGFMKYQCGLEVRLERIENSPIFRTLRALGRVYRRPMAGALNPYPGWRKAGGGKLPHTPSHFPDDYVLLSSKLDVLYAGALDHFAQAAPADIIYSDSEQLDQSGNPLHPVFKPDWSPTLQRSVNYLGSTIAIRRDHAQTPILSIPHPKVVHIPAILYGTRDLTLPTTPATPSPPAGTVLVSVIICTRTARLLETCLAALQNRTDYPHRELVIVQHLGSDDSAIDHIITTHNAKRVPYPGPFNFAAMNNEGAAIATGQILLFLNDDVTPLKPDWLRRLTARLNDPSVGAAGAKLTFPDGTLQHAGVAAYLTDGAWHPGRAVPCSPLWPWNRYTREVSAVTGACLAIRAADFHRLNGFDPAFPVNFNDVDLCFRLQEQGLSVMVDVEAELQHDESRTRAAGVFYEERRLFFRRWSHRLQQPDPFYTSHLAPNTQEFHLR